MNNDNLYLIDRAGHIPVKLCLFYMYTITYDRVGLAQSVACPPLAR